LYNVGIQSSFGYFKTSNLIICTNGFAQSFFPHLDVNPARAQVIVTTPINDLKIKGTFHFDDGYYYFRNIGNRVLLGGGRNLNLEGENTTDLQTTQQIIEALKTQLSSFILPQQPIDIEYEWAGIMGVGLAKRPIIESIDPKIAVGVRMGGMGVAIGASVGKKLADLF
jgi:glycine/D-amino acid oxidase-like deaminating enzyme